MKRRLTMMRGFYLDSVPKNSKHLKEFHEEDVRNAKNYLEGNIEKYKEQYINKKDILKEIEDAFHI